MSISICSGYHYFVNFTNELSRYEDIYLMNWVWNFDEFEGVQSEVVTRKSISSDTDQGDKVFELWVLVYKIRDLWIVQQITPPETSQWYDVSERSNRTLLDSVRSNSISYQIITIVFELAVGNINIHFNR
jgi:hypothetical protein